MKEETSGTPVLTWRHRTDACRFTCFTTTRHGGYSTGEYATFNLGAFCGDDPEKVAFNRAVLCRELGVRPDRLFIPRQIHEDGIFRIDAAFLHQPAGLQSEILEQGYDALMTDRYGVALGITTADCTPVVFYDFARRAIAAAHAGWRGTARGISVRVTEEMIAAYGCSYATLRAVIFPSISAGCYQVGAEVAEALGKTGIAVEKVARPDPASPGRYFVDVAEANRLQLLQAGLPPGHIATHTACTYGQAADFFSARRQGFACGRMVSGIVMNRLFPLLK
ncbi:MAG: peptidoglycan editing factor PgeF [Parabacteroides sp.]|nr:peptidoglycan editing factor PgeF [Parabacteroides sp.]